MSDDLVLARSWRSLHGLLGRLTGPRAEDLANTEFVFADILQLLADFSDLVVEGIPLFWMAASAQLARARLELWEKLEPFRARLLAARPAALDPARNLAAVPLHSGLAALRAFDTPSLESLELLRPFPELLAVRLAQGGGSVLGALCRRCPRAALAALDAGARPSARGLCGADLLRAALCRKAFEEGEPAYRALFDRLLRLGADANLPAGRSPRAPFCGALARILDRRFWAEDGAPSAALLLDRLLAEPRLRLDLLPAPFRIHEPPPMTAEALACRQGLGGAAARIAAARQWAGPRAAWVSAVLRARPAPRRGAAPPALRALPAAAAQ